MSGIGHLTRRGDSQKLMVDTHVSTKGVSVGALHAGVISASSLIDIELSFARMWAYTGRALFFLGALVGTFLLGKYFGYNHDGYQNWIVESVAMTGVGVGLCWSYLIHISGITVGPAFSSVSSSSAISAVLLGISSMIMWSYVQVMQTQGETKRGGWRAVWCSIAQAAYAPPEWRVEQSYGSTSRHVDNSSSSRCSTLILLSRCCVQKKNISIHRSIQFNFGVNKVVQ